MELLVPVQSIENMKLLLEQGIREVYCGFLPESWIKKYNKIHGNIMTSVQVSINRRDTISSNISDILELKQMVQLAGQYNAKIFLTLNAPFYPEIAYEELEDYLNEILKIGIRHLIVSDIGFMQYLKEKHKEFLLSVSCENQVINSMSVLFYKQFHVERIVFPRHISILEIEGIVKEHPDMEFECFVMSNKCIYDDGNCRCMHDLGAICLDMWRKEYVVKNQFGKNIDKYKNASDKFEEWSFNSGTIKNEKMKFWRDYGCSLCSLYNLVKYPNIKALKIVGRGKEIYYEDIEFIREALKMSEGNCCIKDLQLLAETVYGNLKMCTTKKYCIMQGVEDDFSIKNK